MIARELAKRLLETPDAEVIAWNPDAEKHLPVTGLLLRPEQALVQLCTDIEP
jgi:hypothetical protein